MKKSILAAIVGLSIFPFTSSIADGGWLYRTPDGLCYSTPVYACQGYLEGGEYIGNMMCSRKAGGQYTLGIYEYSLVNTPYVCLTGLVR